jgi:osmotically-inducible protein OsmY
MTGLVEQSGQQQGGENAGARPGEPGAEQSLADAARAAILRAGHGRLRWLSVSADGGTVVLGGTVPSYYLKQLAQEAVLGLPGVGAVRNEVRVASD